ncbi:HAD family hydrolase [Streptomyces xiaopingdaonensis]|uniref:HAD family hydrolase n=1 Tax=Streptomyces xiaopingdaonensis TaxID=1565415 RepID=UPI0002FE5259|nr:HAD family hydrolase [Streptomyces xiaopingdaonensis]
MVDPAPNTVPAVGFDLDMTLLDTRPGIRAAYDALAERTGQHIDSALAITRLGPPLEVELAEWFPEDEIPRIAQVYRSLYPQYAIKPSYAMPGAREAVAAVREAGGRVVVVTAKYERNAKLHLDHLGLTPDVLVGDLWAERKAEALRAHEVGVYVGDHLGDVAGAKTAGALSVGVATGPIPADDLRAAGADVVLPELTAFADWWRGHLAS